MKFKAPDNYSVRASVQDQRTGSDISVNTFDAGAEFEIELKANQQIFIAPHEQVEEKPAAKKKAADK